MEGAEGYEETSGRDKIIRSQMKCECAKVVMLVMAGKSFISFVGYLILLVHL